jgi:hypothetical protein
MAEVLGWQKSSFSEGDDAPNCLEIAAAQGAPRLRESEEPGTVVTTTATGLAALIRHLRPPRAGR